MEDPPPGFRFYPTEEELVSFYLHKQLQGQSHLINRVIPVIDINGVEPWNLPTLAGELCRGDSEQWFFFSARQEREARGGRPNRTTSCGYWKATGSPSHVYSSENRVIGIKKTMVFYKGKAPSGRKTKWKLHEYKAIQHSHQSDTAPPKLMQEFSLCRVYVISGSFRSFDRRPIERPRHEFDHHVASTSVQQATDMEVDGSFSPVTSHSGGVEGDHGTHDGTNWNVVANNDNNNNNNGVEFEEPVWDWEQLDWV